MRINRYKKTKEFAQHEHYIYSVCAYLYNMSSACEYTTDLHKLVSVDDVDSAFAVLEHVIEVNIQDSKGMTALHIAAKNGYFFCLDMLLQANASPHVLDRNGNTALHYAARHMHWTCVEALLCVHSCVSVFGDQGTPLMTFLLQNMSEIHNADFKKTFEILQNAKSDINARKHGLLNGYNVLEYCISQDEQQMVRFLCKHRALYSPNKITPSSLKSCMQTLIAGHQMDAPPLLHNY